MATKHSPACAQSKRRLHRVDRLPATSSTVMSGRARTRRAECRKTPLSVATSALTSTTRGWTTVAATGRAELVPGGPPAFVFVSLRS